jgi:autotransporter passenger strand-loop-strand repeat protein
MSGTVVSSGEVLSLTAAAADITVENGGTLIVAAGGTAEASTVSAGGTELVASAGITEAPTLAATGSLTLDAGGVVSGGIVFAGDAALLAIVGSAMPQAIISGFGAGGAHTEAIELASVPYSSLGGAVQLGAGNVLSVTEGGQTYRLNLDPAQNFADERFVLAQGGGGTQIIAIPCFAAGTRLTTPAGGVAVECLRAGDAVLASVDGVWQARAVRWIGATTIDLAANAAREHLAPVRLRAHSFGPQLPERDLLLSPDHAILVDEALIQARALLNGATIVQEFPAQITYFHIELDRHAVLLAEGLAVESYLDTGNRALFRAGAEARARHPELAATAWDERACAPLLLGGARVAAAHARLLARAEALGWRRASDPSLVLFADGKPLARASDGSASLPAGTREVRLQSSTFVPAWLDHSDDRRRLGVAVVSLRLGGRELAGSAYGKGWHAPERAWRWTDGDAHLTLAPPARPTRLAVALARAAGRCFWREPAASGPVGTHSAST